MATDPVFQDLYRSEFANVFATTYLLCRDDGIADEATQEAFTRALERWNRLKGQPWLGGWLTTTAMNVARRHLRKRRLPSARETVEGEPEAAIDLWRAVRSLPLREQQAVVLRYRLDLPTDAIAQAMQCRESSVRAYLSRAVAALKVSLRDPSDVRP